MLQPPSISAGGHLCLKGKFSAKRVGDFQTELLHDFFGGCLFIPLPRFICESSTADRHIIRSRRSSRHSLAHCVSPPLGTKDSVTLPSTKEILSRSPWSNTAQEMSLRSSAPSKDWADILDRRTNLIKFVGEATDSSWRRTFRRVDACARRAETAFSPLERISKGIPLLGICLGLQAMFETSDERPAWPGLDYSPKTFPSFRRIEASAHGLESTSPRAGSHTPRRYFAASVFLFCALLCRSRFRPENAAVAWHGRDFIAAVERRNIFGVQFHPEKTGAVGAQVLTNFVRYAA